VVQEDPDAIQGGMSYEMKNVSNEKPQASDAAPPNKKPGEVPANTASTKDLASEEGKTTARNQTERTTIQSVLRDTYQWARETFPTTMTVFSHLPFALVPFAFCMFVLVQALVTKGWVPVFAYGWDHWVEKTGTVGAVGGMGFLAVILCNVSYLLVVRIEKS
jgi:hypothetical protein